ncbi:valyl-tRNA synthetase [Cutibacterium acnes JCM 18918]|nr:valyl-tRNA synthetase [Cutibacterium acnes JCM 18918]
MTSQTFTTSSATPPTRGVVPDKPALEGLEVKWGKIWEDEQLYAFDATTVDSREQVFAIDTPPPTVSGHLHPGHVFSYTHTDTVARYQRMRGKKVFLPDGWDDNGLPTERRVQNYYGVRCDPSLPYDPDFTPPSKPNPKRQVPISRRNFVELCVELTAVDEKKLSRTCGGLSACLWTGTSSTRRSRQSRSGSPSWPSSATTLVARRTCLTPPLCGTSPSPPPSPRLSSRLATTPVLTTASASTVPMVKTSSSKPPGPSCWPLAAPSSLTPTTSAISTSSAPPSPLRCTESRCRCWPTRLRDGQGCRHRHVLYLR